MHYICEGECSGESATPGICRDEECTKHGEALTECDCEDGLHENVLPDEEMAGFDAEDLKGDEEEEDEI